LLATESRCPRFTFRIDAIVVFAVVPCRVLAAAFTLLTGKHISDIGIGLLPPVVVTISATIATGLI
jgi:hypothetical protein